MLPTMIDRELQLRRVLADWSRCPETDPIVRETAAQIMAILEQGRGEVTLTFTDHRLTGATPAIEWRLNTLHTMPRG
jgi:hypothetical protein